MLLPKLFPKMATIVVLATSVLAAPIDPPEPDEVPSVSWNPSFQTKRALEERAADYCGPSTFVNKSSSGSPFVDDCRALADDARTLETYWVRGHCWGNCKLEIGSYGSCVFGISCDSITGAGCYVGSDDIADLIYSSIDKFQWEGRVGAEGHMNCKAVPSLVPLGTSWAIWHT